MQVMKRKALTSRWTLLGAAIALAATAAMATSAPDQQDERERRMAQQPDRARQAEPAPLRGHHVAFLVGDGFHDLETLVPMAYLINRGARVTVIGIEPGMLQAYNSDITVRVERGVDRVNPNMFTGMVLPGGRGPANLRENEAVVAFAKEFFETGRPVAAICHGPQVLVTAGVLDGRKATCIADISSELEEAGAEYHDEPVVVDDNLITSRVPDDIPAFCQAIEKALMEARPGAGRPGMRPADRPRERGDREQRGGRGDDRRGGGNR